MIHIKIPITPRNIMQHTIIKPPASIIQILPNMPFAKQTEF